jgi:hypothetical protein
MHDAGLAAWFGGSLMGAVGLNGAAAEVSSPAERLQVASAGWDRWAPVNAAAIGAHLAGGTAILLSESRRVAAQRGVGAMTVTKAALTAAALGSTAYSRLLGKKMEKTASAPTEGITEPATATPADVGKAQRQQRIAQWAIPLFTGALLVVSSLAGEQQKPRSILRGVAARARRVTLPF